MQRKSGFIPAMWVIALASLFIVLWYARLSERQKQFVFNLLRQVPDLPSRYMV